MYDVYGYKGNILHIYNKVTKEGRSFDDFGSEVTNKGNIISASSINPASIVSVINGGTVAPNELEIFFNNRINRFKGEIRSVAKMLRPTGYIGTMNYIVHKELAGSPMQLVFVYKEGNITEDQLTFALGLEKTLWRDV